ncbi:hypothetical protein SEUCBS139899_003199 [Sporothrix eucalyptigena]|uniref:Zn(2)-C6 fungal-type domain-containing protein n=1 Tax=Sporothrix eucalyptigena TaxID=1812306 RepID=A0ABP0CGV9_9PEZI
MRLRRGMVRESCDFCHRRKIKCDRLSRNDLGHAACSQCSLRSLQCRMDDSDDIRLRGRCRPAPSSLSSMSGPGLLVSPMPSTVQTTPSPSLRQKDVDQTSVPRGPSSATTEVEAPVTPATAHPLVLAASPISTSSMVPSSMDEQTNEAMRNRYNQGLSSQEQQQHLSQLSATATLATPPSTTLDVDSVDSLLVQPPPPTNNTLSTTSLPYNSFNTPLVNNAPSSSSMTEEFMFLDDPFHLNAGSIFFLDQIFMGYPDANASSSAAAWPSTSSDMQPLMLTQSMPSAVQSASQTFDADTSQQFSNQPSTVEQLPPQQQIQEQQPSSGTSNTGLPMKDGGYDPPPWTRCGLDETTFMDALQAYFSYVTLFLPILLEDAFWQDYRAGRCSLSIIYAVACRGLPYTCQSEDKTAMWAQQQRVAEQFREAFFAAQLNANNNHGKVRLDDLEALALMVYFKYNIRPNPGNDLVGSSPATDHLSQLHAHLAGLYLTHDSLVLMTMQSGIDTPDLMAKNHNPPSTDPKAPLARLNDRRILLFWHVYGLDAFHCLDKKLLSRIPDCHSHILLPVTSPSFSCSNTTSAKKIPHHSRHPDEARGYLDAVLDLAVIARKALVWLSNATARRRGVRADDLESVYGLLQQWQSTACPPHLRRQRDPKTNTLSLSAGLDKCSSNAHIIQLHRAVIWILEINCYMQVEDCVCEYGIYEPTTSPFTLDAETIALRVESETVRQLRDGVEIARSILQYAPDSNGNRHGYALADLGASIIRDCCIGMAQWACHHACQQLRQPLPAMLQQRRQAAGNDAAVALDRQRQRMASYIEGATVLRDLVATAVSHIGTMPAVKALDDRIAALTAEMEEMGVSR